MSDASTSQQESQQTSKDHGDAKLAAMIQESLRLVLADQKAGFRQAIRPRKFRKNNGIDYSLQQEKESDKAGDNHELRKDYLVSFQKFCCLNDKNSQGSRLLLDKCLRMRWK